MPRNYESSEGIEAPWPRAVEQRTRPHDGELVRYFLAQHKKWETRARMQPNAVAPTPGPSRGLTDQPTGFRPPREEEICIDPPQGPWDPLGPLDSLPDYTTVQALTSLDDPEEIWLYASGGGIRSPQATLGTAWYLDYIDHWRFVTRIMSVSGGAIANAEFAAQARAGARRLGANVAGRPTDFVADFHRRLATQHRWVLSLLATVMMLIAVAASFAMWQTPATARWLADKSPFRWGCVAVVVMAAVALLAILAQRSRTLFAATLFAIAAVVALVWWRVRIWSALPTGLQWLLIGVAALAVLAAIWQLTGPDFGCWLLVVVVAVAGLVAVRVVLWEPTARANWQWLAWLITILLLALLLWFFLAALQYGIHLTLRYRITRMLDHATNPPPESLNEIQSELVHVFSTSDYRTGQSVYFSAGPVQPGVFNAVAVHDMSSPLNAIDYYDAQAIALRDTVYDSAALPGLVWPQRRTMNEAFPNNIGRPTITPVAGVWHFGQGAMAPAAPRIQPESGTFTPLDGGLNSTLGTQFDPLLDGLIDERGTMEVFDHLYPLADRPNVQNHHVRRIVVDSGQYLDETAKAFTLASAWIGLSALLTLKRGINIANLSLLESERQLTMRPGTDIWYVSTTGGDRTFRLKFTVSAVNALATAGRADPTIDPLRELILERGTLMWFNGPMDPNLVEIAQSIDRVLLLKERTDRVSLINGQAEYGFDAMASGVANSYVEHRGVDNDLQPLEKCLFELDEQLLHPDAIARVLFGTKLPLAISHQGLRPAGVRGNTADAFLRALQAGFTMLEVDVMVTSDDVLVALHPGTPPGGAQNFTASNVRRTASANLSNQLQGLARLEHLLNPIAHAADLFPNDTIKVATTRATTLATAIWNVEAKDKASAVAVAKLLNRLNGEQVNPQVFFSGGWLIRPLRAFRKIRPDIGTACHWWEALRLALGFSAGAPLLMQAPVVEPAAWWARPFVIRLLRRSVRQGRAHGKVILWFKVDHADAAIKLRSLVPCHGVMTEGAHVLVWSKFNFWRASGGQAP